MERQTVPEDVGAHRNGFTAFLRKALPDVPEDVDDTLAHLNDPNWDMKSVRSQRSSISFEMDRKEKGKSFGAESLDYTSGASDVDTESQVDTTTRGADSHAQLREQDEIEYNDDSPYLEVRAAVSNIDDPSMPVSTFRMWFLGLSFSALVAGLNQFFSMRYPSLWIAGVVIQLIALPMGRFLEWALPTTRFRTFGFTWSLNPGPFNIKEHTVITVMANLSQWGAPASDVYATQRLVYGQTWGIGYQILLPLSSQLIGMSFAGLVRRFLVWPSSMIWPGALVNASLFNTLHKNYGKREKRHMSREKFFLCATMCSFVWYWIPGYLWTGLSLANWICWIAPNNLVVNQVFGTVSGLGMSLITLDWTMISFIGSPLVVPWWAELNTFASFVFWFWIITPILYYKNVFFSKFMPISTYGLYDNTGAAYDPTKVFMDGVFNSDMYEKYSPLFMPTTFALSYGIAFAAVTSIITHTLLWYRRDLLRQLRRTLKDEKDVHSRLMSVYPETPLWWFGALFAVCYAIGIVVIKVWPTQLPVWAFTLCLAIACVFVVPCGIIQAITNQSVPLNVMMELFGGYLLPQKPVAVLCFKVFGEIGAGQGIGFAGDLKLGHYMKIPPRTMFAAQVGAGISSAISVVFVQSWMFANIPGMCTPDQPHGFTCPGTMTFAAASMIWGGIGPQKVFSKGSLYFPLTFFFLLGALAPIPFYYLARRYPRSAWRYVNMPVFFNGVTAIPPASGINFASWFCTGFVFQFWMRRFHFRWWMRFNYILSAALDSGVAIGMIVIFFTVLFPHGGVTVNWWGNTVWMKTLDAMGAPFYTLQPGETFGPSKW